MLSLRTCYVALANSSCIMVDQPQQRFASIRELVLIISQHLRIRTLLARVNPIVRQQPFGLDMLVKRSTQRVRVGAEADCQTAMGLPSATTCIGLAKTYFIFRSLCAP